MVSARTWLCIGCLSASLLRPVGLSADEPSLDQSQSVSTRTVDRSPVDLALTPDGQFLLAANQTSDSVSLVRLADGSVADEIAVGRRPVAIALSADGRTAAVTASSSGELWILDCALGRLRSKGSILLGAEPHGVAISPDAKRAYVALSAAGEVAVVRLAEQKLEARIAVGRWPRYLALSPDGSRLAVGMSGEGGIAVVDTHSGAKLYETRFYGLNIGHLAASADGQFVYFPWVVYADRPITPSNIRQGWVLGNRLARVRLDGFARREAMALDPRGRGVADPHGLALSPDGISMAFTASGTGELIVVPIDKLPLSADGTGDHLKPELADSPEVFRRLSLGGRPLAVRYEPGGKRVYVANYLTNAVQVVDVENLAIERTISLGPAPEPSLARRGEAIFHDAHRSTDGWYSCHTCHYEGGTNSVTMDTRNDDSWGTYKMVLPLRNAQHTGPWFWHGLVADFPAALRKSLVGTMQGPEPTDEDVAAVAAFLETLGSKATVEANQEASAAAQRGRTLFHAEGACASCHSGPYFTDGAVHEVGTGTEYDVHKGFNTPSLVGVSNRINWLHHGRAKSLEQLLGDLHSPKKVSGAAPLSPQEISDLIEYLRTL